MTPGLTNAQQKMAERFFIKHLGTRLAPAQGFRPGELPARVFGIDGFDAHYYASMECENVFREMPGLSQRNFEAEMRRRITKLDELNSWSKKFAERRMPAQAPVAAALAGVCARLHPPTPFAQKIRGVRFNVRAAASWVKTPRQKLGGFTLKPCLLPHADAPLALEVLDKKGRRVATIGGFATVNGRVKTLVITNIQGVSPPKLDEYMPTKLRDEILAEHDSGYARLSELLGENWRVGLSRKAREFAEAHGWQIAGAMPAEWLFPKNDEGRRRYARVARQYKQTYRKADVPEQTG